jgi:hypothetical protein
MALRVVDRLQPVHVDSEHGEIEFGSRAACQLAIEIPLEASPVRTPGERIAERSALELVGRRAGGGEHRPID